MLVNNKYTPVEHILVDILPGGKHQRNKLYNILIYGKFNAAINNTTIHNTKTYEQANATIAMQYKLIDSAHGSDQVEKTYHYTMQK